MLENKRKQRRKKKRKADLNRDLDFCFHYGPKLEVNKLDFMICRIITSCSDQLIILFEILSKSKAHRDPKITMKTNLTGRPNSTFTFIAIT